MAADLLEALPEKEQVRLGRSAHGPSVSGARRGDSCAMFAGECGIAAKDQYGCGLGR